METTLVLNPAIQDLIEGLLMMILVGAVSSIAYYGTVWIRTKIGKERFEQFIGYVRLAVQTTEQMGLKGVIENVAATKKEYALKAIDRWTKAHGLTEFDEAAAADALEAALREGVHKGFNIELIEPIQVEALPAPKDEEE